MDSLRGPGGVFVPFTRGHLPGTFAPVPSQEPAPQPPRGDHVDIASRPVEFPTHPGTIQGPAELPSAVPQIEIRLPGPSTGAPLFLAGESFYNAGPDTVSAAPAAGRSAVSSLGVLAQLDEPAATTAVRAVDSLSRPSPFSDMHVIGPGNAAQFLANPNSLYLGI